LGNIKKKTKIISIVTVKEDLSVAEVTHRKINKIK
jgi:hypothetical protein